MDVCLVSMPYAAVERPSIALGLLAAALRGADVGVECRYACLDFAERIGLPAYDGVLNSQTTLFIGEWTFAAAAFPAGGGQAHLPVPAEAGQAGVPVLQPLSGVDVEFLRACAEEVAKSRIARDPAEVLVSVRAAAAPFVEELADEIVARKPRIVGCTSTFQQHTASLALLRAIRARDPEIITMIGGTNCESSMGMATRRAFPWVDYVFSGEADEVIAPFVRALLERGRGVEAPPGVIDGRIAAERGEAPRASVWSVDAIPTPDYDDYFSQLERSALRESITPAVVVETSRGCWWGAKSHCTFCGLNGGNMAYRAKSPARAVEEFHRLAARYGVRRFTLVDNIIDMQYHQHVLPQLAGHGYDIFYETKANLRRAHMQNFTDAGVRSIQPGMESFHDEILKLLAKGNRAWMNVQLLKWAAELGMDITWIFLIDVPGQRDEWYREMLAWLPLITHLAPPATATPIQFVRFSPYHRDAEKFALDLVPEPAYAHVYPLADGEMRELAYYFAEREPAERAGFAQRLLVAWLGIWRDAHHRGEPARLELWRDGETLDLVDTRSCSVAPLHRLEGLAARVYDACDEAVERTALPARVNADAADVDDVVASLLASRLLLDFNGRLLALAVDRTRPLPADAPNPGGSVNWERVAATTG